LKIVKEKLQSYRKFF